MQVPTAFLYLPISYLSSYWKKQNQNFTGFGSLDLIHFLGHGPVFTCLICPISIKPLTPADPSLFLLWPLSSGRFPSLSCLSYRIRNSVSHNFSLLTVFLTFLIFLPALWLISQFRILLPPVWPPCPWSHPLSIQPELKSTFIFKKLSSDHMGLSYSRTFNGSPVSAKFWLSCLSCHWPTLPTTNMHGTFLYLIMSVPSWSSFSYLCLPEHYLSKWAIKISGERDFQMKGILGLQIT